MAALEAATGCESLALRRQGQTILARERYLRFPDDSTLRTLAENYDHSRRRPVEVPKWSPETTPAPLNVKLDIGLPGGKSEYAPCVLKAASLDCIEQ